MNSPANTHCTGIKNAVERIRQVRDMTRLIDKDCISACSLDKLSFSIKRTPIQSGTVSERDMHWVRRNAVGDKRSHFFSSVLIEQKALKALFSNGIVIGGD